MALRGTLNDENGAALLYRDYCARAAGSQADYQWCFKPAQ
jgi:hypothetical protein